MRCLLHFIITFSFVFSFVFSIKGQNIDSLYIIARDFQLSDSVRISAYRSLVNNYLAREKVDSLKNIFDEAITIAESSQSPFYFGFSYNFLGLYYDIFSTHQNYDSALTYYYKGFKHISKESPNEIHAILCNNIAAIHHNISQLDSCKYYAELGYQYADSLDNYLMKSSNLGMLSSYYRTTGNYSKALECHNKALELARIQGDSNRIMLSLLQIGTTNIRAEKFEEGIEILKSVLINFGTSYQHSFKQVVNLNIGAAYIDLDNYIDGLKYTYTSINHNDKNLSYYVALNNMATSYSALLKKGYPIDKIPIFQQLNQLEFPHKKFPSIENLIISYFSESITGFQRLNNDFHQVHPNIGLGDYYKRKKSLPKAKKHYQIAYDLAYKNKLLVEQNKTSKKLYKITKLLGKTKEALQWHEIYITTKDSLNSKENQQEIGRQLAQFEFSNIRLKDSLEQIKKDAIQQLHIEQQNQNIKNERIKKYYLYGGLSITILLLLFLFRRFNMTQKQKQLIEQQKTALEEKQIELSRTHLAIKDSINYSQKIQKAILPSKTTFDSIFPNNFILYQPKDIVSGDFYWCYEVNKKKVVVLGDCTGHGVPGAFMTIIGINILKEVLHDGTFESAEILRAVNLKLKSRLNHNSNGINDGMDLGICVIDEQIIEFSGAHFPLYHISKNQLIEYKGSKIFLGNNDYLETVKTHYIPYKKGEYIYLITDGFPDQRGGGKGKKYYYKPLRNLLIEHAEIPLSEQKLLLQTELENWIKKGNNTQMDDVSIIGIKL